jgi:sigma-B regulation protein RsbU (phosphoserine phosphatase)
MAQAIPLALFPDLSLDAQTVVIPECGTLLLYTDGVTEAMDAQGELFGLEHLRATVQGQTCGSAQALCDSLIESLMAYHMTAPQSDDITIVAVRAQPLATA